jgi:DNA polymerase-3 subunit gamma/tau
VPQGCLAITTVLSSYQVLARRTRPQTFAQVIGQEHVTRTLENAIASGRLAHAFVFSGVRGVGKTTTARILAKALNCEKGPTPEPCNACRSCVEITECRSLDVFEVDAASQTGIDQTRELLETVKYQPAASRFRVYIIDEAHGLSGKAFDAFLKTLEEPPPHVKFILATTSPGKLPATILSRCQRYDFRRVSRAEIAAALGAIVAQEAKAADEEALLAIACEADGSLRDAVSLLDQALAFADGRLDAAAVTAALGLADRSAVRELMAAVVGREPARALAVVTQVASLGTDLRRFCRDLLERLRNMTVLAVAGRDALTDLTPAEVDELAESAASAPLSDLQRWFKILLDGDEEIGRSPYPRLVLEMTVVRMAILTPLVPLDQLVERLEALERGARGAGAAGAGAAPSRPSSPAPSDTARSAGPRPTSPAAVRPATAPGSSPAADAAPAGDRQGSSAAAAAHPQAANGGDPHPLQARWDALVATLQREQLSRFFHLAHSRVLTVDDECIRIGVTRKEAVAALTDASSRSTIEDRLERELRRRLALEVVSPGKDAAASPAPTVASLERQAREDPVVQASVELLDGRVEAVVPRTRR